ncbi:E4 [Canine papillomavirus type 24]|nr:E4 [Canine papillomavirus type 24]
MCLGVIGTIACFIPCGNMCITRTAMISGARSEVRWTCLEYGSGTMATGGTMWTLALRIESMVRADSGMCTITMNNSAPPNLSLAPHRPPTLVSRLYDLLTGNGTTDGVTLELQDIKERGRTRGHQRLGDPGQPSPPLTPPSTPAPEPRRRRRHGRRSHRQGEWEDLQLKGACAPSPPSESSPSDDGFWFPKSQEYVDHPLGLSPCPGASVSPCSTPSHRFPTSPLDYPIPLPRPSPLPLPDTRPSLQQQEKALKKALRQLERDAYLLKDLISQDLDTFFDKLGIVPRQ